jgi:hypothetical protein
MGCLFSASDKATGKVIAKTTKKANKMEIYKTKSGKWPKSTKSIKSKKSQGIAKVASKKFWDVDYDFDDVSTIKSKSRSKNGYFESFNAPDQCQSLPGFSAQKNTFGDDSSPVWIGSCKGQEDKRRVSFRLVIRATDFDVVSDVSKADNSCSKNGEMICDGKCLSLITDRNWV